MGFYGRLHRSFKEMPMCMQRRAWIAGLVAIQSLLLAPPTAVPAQNVKIADSGWAALERMDSEAGLAVRMKNGKELQGKLNGISETGLRLATKDQPMNLTREDIRSVHQITRKSAKKITLIGAVLGAGAGVATGWAIGDSSPGAIVKKSQLAPACGAVGAGIGAIMGFAMGRGHKRVLVYQAPD
jgi:hypothetical protein